MSTPWFKHFTFETLLTAEGLKRLDDDFLNYIGAVDALLMSQLQAYRSGQVFSPKEESLLLIAMAPILEAYLAELFGIENEVGQLQARTLSHDPIFAFKKYFVLREARRALSSSEGELNFDLLNQKVQAEIKSSHVDYDEDPELKIAHYAQRLLEEPKANDYGIRLLTDWCVAAMSTAAGRAYTKKWISFKLPQKLDFEHLVELIPVTDDPLQRKEAPQDKWRLRDGFKLTDSRMSLRQVLDEIHYCVYCHKNEGDFCSKGFPIKKNEPALGLKVSPLGDVLTGCPLEEKISEMHTLKKSGYGIAALAMVMVDNPMCPATGHRICNDCMKACIYQKQDPVNIPETETRVLTDVLDLPWGVEIYDLLTRWNPLRRTQYLIKPYNGLKVLVMGMGPAGFTLAHHLTMEGFAVLGAEGLKLEALDSHLLTQPIRDFSSLKEESDNRVMAGFGGVAEYGITVRWDKNFLKLIYITLSRRKYFQVVGGVRFGGTLTVDDAWNLGFDHLAIAVGAGLPRELPIPGSLAPGMRQANDFLMALQLTGAAKQSSLANLQVRLPAVVVGGGLTGIDTATEVQAYYIVQVEKILMRYQSIIEKSSEKTVREKFTPAELEILDEFLAHGQEVHAERLLAIQEDRKANFIQLIRQWGGVTVAYRRSIEDSPAYKRNHEEIIKAMEEGLYYAEGLEPSAVVLDEHGYAKALKCLSRVLDEEGYWKYSDEEQLLPARSIFIATGAKPNVAYEFEHRGTFNRDGFEYLRYRLDGDALSVVEKLDNVKAEEFGAFTSYRNGHRFVTFLGDTHPVFHGSVVKAIASAKRVYPKIIEVLSDKVKRGDEKEYHHFREQMEGMFRSEVVSVERLNSSVVELKVKAPMAARNYHPGQFYRVQNYERTAPKIGDQRMHAEALALLGIRRASEPDVLSFVVVEEGASSRVLSMTQPGQPISVMGPTGAKMAIPGGGQTIMIIGGLFAAAYTVSIAPVLRAKGNRVIYVGTFKSAESVIYRDELEQNTDAILWIGIENETIPSTRPVDRSLQGDIVLALRDYAKDPVAALRLDEVDQLMVIGTSDLLRSIQKSRGGLLQKYFKKGAKFVASVYGPMQCMLKGVCAQCLQWQIDPATGKRTKAVYACSWQHQPMEIVDIGNLDERLSQNSVQEKIAMLCLG